MTPIQVKVSGDRQVLQVLGGLIDRLDNPRALLLEIGEEMVERTKQRFDTLIGPDGQPWAANAESTFDAYLRRFNNSRNKDGSLSKTGQARKAGKKPLTGETKALRGTINYQLEGNNAVRIGSPMQYAPFQQYGTQAHTIVPATRRRWPSAG
jgi:phage gpG-like protein